MMNELTTTPTVTIKGDAVVANSRDVADYFGKHHAHVLRDIDNILKNNNIQNLADWFVERVTPRPAENPGRPLRQYDMTRDGFTILVMGYTGEKAMGFKVRYIQEFSRMEAKLREQVQTVPTNYKNALLALVATEEKREQSASLTFTNPAEAARKWATQYEQRQVLGTDGD